MPEKQSVKMVVAMLSLMRWPLDCSRDRRAWSQFKIERVLSVRLRTKNGRSTGLRGVGRNDHRPFRPKNLLVFGTPTESISERVRGLQPSASVIPRTLSEMDSVGVPHSQIFRPKRSMIVASYAPEPCRSSVFGPKPYAQHPFDFELAPSTTISGAV